MIAAPLTQIGSCAHKDSSWKAYHLEVNLSEQCPQIGKGLALPFNAASSIRKRSTSAAQ